MCLATRQPMTTPDHQKRPLVRHVFEKMKDSDLKKASQGPLLRSESFVFSNAWVKSGRF